MSELDTWLAHYRAAGEPMTIEDRAVHHALVAFCEQHRAWPRLDGGETADLWGFGYVPVRAVAEDGTGLWLHLADLMEPTGVTYMQLRAAFDQDLADEYSDVALVTLPHGGLHLVKTTFAMRVFMGMSPWAKEWWANTKDLLRLGFLHSGLADTLGMADGIRGEGPLPSVEVARHTAFRGPRLDGDQQ
ncbi:hypothetical protein [Streptomyces tremellae]|uniref:Uncharacterized protein n=1 Tax=Streptomyces tremellae TaxID=1124239 RepID=A0ABP7EY43_9ACTN